MASKSNIEVLIGGKVYTLSGYEGEEYMQKVAAYINNKINEFNDMESVRRFPVEMKSVLLQLNIADDYFKAKERVEQLEKDVEQKEKELYAIKHELINFQIQLESCEKAQHELELKNKELLLNKAKLEAALEEELLGKISTEKEEKKEKPKEKQGEKPVEKPEEKPVEKTAEELEEEEFLRELAALEEEEKAAKEKEEKEKEKKGKV